MEAFPDLWEEIYSIAMVRVADHVPLKRVESAWDKFYNADRVKLRRRTRAASCGASEAPPHENGTRLI